MIRLSILFVCLLVSSCGVQKSVQQSPQTQTTDDVVLHKVLKGETIGQIANKYSVTPNEIRNWNPGVSDFPKPETFIRIELKSHRESIEKEKQKKREEEEKKKQEAEDEKNKSVNIALLLPLYLDKSNQQPPPGEDPFIESSAMPALQFYEGTLIAVDSLAQKGIRIKLTVIDATDTSETLKKINGRIFEENHLIISGTQAFSEKLIQSSKKINRPVIFTPTFHDSVLTSNRNIILLSPSIELYCREMISYLVKENEKEKFILITRDNKREQELIRIFNAHLAAIKEKNTTFDFAVAKYDDANFEKLQAVLSTTRKNVIIIPSSDEAYVSPLLTRLHELKEYSKVIAGLPAWELFESIEPDVLQELNTHIFSNNYIDYNSHYTAAIRKKFIERFKTDPLFNAYLGFNSIYFFSERYCKKPERIFDSLPYDKNIDMEFPFIFERKTEADGAENSLVPILKFENYELVRVSR